MFHRRTVQIAVFALAFVVNPGYFAGCVVSDDEPTFGEAEMLELLDAANEQGPWEFESEGTRYALTLELEQAAGDDTMVQRNDVGALWHSRAFACGTRTFMKSASACFTTSELLIAGTVKVRDLENPTTIVSASEGEGSIWTGSKNLTGAILRIRTDHGMVGLDWNETEGYVLNTVDITSQDGSTAIRYDASSR